jgi:hypothetical protein
MTDLLSVDTCTDLLPEKKPRYVMGIVRMVTNLPESALTIVRAIQKISSLQWPSVRICSTAYGLHVLL